jgi:DNA polymerase-3 subunit delta'
VELVLRDMMCLREGAQELVYGVDRMGELEVDAKAHGGASARAGVELVRATRARIALNVGEELALEALAYRLQALAEG